MSETKIFESHIKAIDAAQGIATTVVAAFGNVDSMNDRILPGAFDATIQKWKARMAQGKFLPVVYGHRDDPGFILGKVIDMRATAEGFEVDSKYFLKNPNAQATFEAQEAGVLNGSSFAYDIIRAKRAQDGTQELLELDVIEVGPTMYPANDATRVVGIKDLRAALAARTELDAPTGTEHETKVGRTISSATERRFRERLTALEQIHAGMVADLDELTTSGAGPEKAAEEPQVKADEPELPPVLAATRALFQDG